MIYFGAGSQPTPENLIKIYENNPLVFACVDKNAKSIAEYATKFHLYRFVNDEKQEIFDHPVISLLENINDQLDAFSLWYSVSSFLDTIGRALLFLDKPINPQRIDLLPCHAIKIISDDIGLVKEYEYRISPNKTLTLPIDQVIDFRQTRIYHIYTSHISPLMTVYDDAKLVDLLTTWENEAIEKRGNIKWMFTPAEDIDSESLKKIQKDIDNRVTDPKRSVIGIQYNGKLVQASYQPFDLAPLNLKDQTLKIIGNVFGIPEGIFSKEANRSSAETAQYQYANSLIKPRLTQLAEVLNKQLVSKYDDNLYIEFENPVPEDKQYQLNLAEKADQSTVLTINEKRRLWGMNGIDGGDELVQQQNDIQLDAKTLLILNEYVHDSIIPRAEAINILAKLYNLEQKEASKLVGYPKSEIKPAELVDLFAENLELSKKSGKNDEKIELDFSPLIEDFDKEDDDDYVLPEKEKTVSETLQNLFKDKKNGNDS